MQRALKWSQKSCELLANPAHFDTYAHLLFRLDNKAEALIQQQKAIDLAKAAKDDSKLYEAEYLKMIQNTL